MILLRNPARGRVPLLPTLPTLASFPGVSSAVGAILDLFLGGVLQSGGRLETTTILGVP